MIKVIESNSSVGKKYIRYMKTDGAWIISKKIIIFHSVISEAGQLFHLLCNSKWEQMNKSFVYLNNAFYRSSMNTVVSHIEALKLYFAFMEIHNIRNEDFNDSRALEFLRFLEGVNFTTDLVIYELSQIRSESTVNKYLTSIRAYLKYIGIKNSSLLKTVDTSLVYRGSLSADKQMINREKYKYSLNRIINDKVLPRYITSDEFDQIIKKLQESNNLRNEIIVRLMYESGLRIGEVLGLTLEDLRFSKYQMTSSSKEELYVLELRNRLTDKLHQCAKGCKKINSMADYMSKGYKTSGVGFQRTFISFHLANLIIKYRESLRLILSESSYKRSLESAKADRVVNNDFVGTNNYYLFLSNQGNPMSKSGWNKSIKKVLDELEIFIEDDEDEKERGLNHAFRHGCAMFLLNEVGFSLLMIKDFLRHKSIETTNIYLQYTKEKKHEIRNKSIKFLYEKYPELNKETNYEE